MQLDVIGDRLVDQIAARTALCGGQRIKRFNSFSDSTETDGFLVAAHNTRTITHIILYYKFAAAAMQARFFERWRRRRDSNPRDPFESNGFQDRRLQPLGHSSALIKNNLPKVLLHIRCTF